MTRPGADSLTGLERGIYEALIAFPDRIDFMETRSEENCRRLACVIAVVVAQECSSRGGSGDS